MLRITCGSLPTILQFKLGSTAISVMEEGTSAISRKSCKNSSCGKWATMAALSRPLLVPAINIRSLQEDQDAQAPEEGLFLRRKINHTVEEGQITALLVREDTVRVERE